MLCSSPLNSAGDTGAVSARRFLDNEQEHESLEVAYDVNEGQYLVVGSAAARHQDVKLNYMYLHSKKLRSR